MMPERRTIFPEILDRMTDRLMGENEVQLEQWFSGGQLWAGETHNCIRKPTIEMEAPSMAIDRKELVQAHNPEPFGFDFHDVANDCCIHFDALLFFGELILPSFFVEVQGYLHHNLHNDFSLFFNMFVYIMTEIIVDKRTVLW